MKIFLAGTYAEKNYRDILKQSPFLLESFFYIKDWQIEDIPKHREFLLDSGAFTFITNGKQKIDWNDYVFRYVEFIKENKIERFFELDIDSVIGYEKVKEFRKEIERKTGRQCIPVWHKSRGLEEFRRLAEEYKYIALGGIAAKEISQNEHRFFPYLIEEAHKRGAKIHGLGFSSIAELPKYHFDSVDSTRWNSARFGGVEFFDGKGMRRVKAEEGMKMVGRKNPNVIRKSLTEWIKFQEYAETHL